MRRCVIRYAAIIAVALSLPVRAQDAPGAEPPEPLPASGLPPPKSLAPDDSATRAMTPAAAGADPAVANPAPTADVPTGWSLPIIPQSMPLFEASSGFSFHKPTYLLPATWAEPYQGRSTEVLFALSFKLKLSPWPFYFAYSQKSFFQAYNSKKSKPFRESDFNPELFYRFTPQFVARYLPTGGELGSDVGIEHESNGQSLPGSRSWNRLYVAPYWRHGDTGVYWKWWYRLPEDKSVPRTDPNRDDNPDIQDYLGYSELHVEQQFHLIGDSNLAHLTARWNPQRGRGAVSLLYSVPVLYTPRGPRFYVQAYVWQGYGESLLDYDRSITRVGMGVSISR